MENYPWAYNHIYSHVVQLAMDMGTVIYAMGDT